MEKKDENNISFEIENLKKENAYLSGQLIKLNQKLKESDAFKSHFISNITNEIINPFTSILGISKGIISLNEDKIGQIHSMSNLIYNEAFDLDFQLQNIFSAAIIESGEINLELSSINPEESINDIIDSLRFKSEKKSQYIELSKTNVIDHNLITDQEKFTIIIKNVLSNAIIFGKEKSKIGVELGQNNESLEIKITNDGNLLNMEDLNEIFNRFSKLDKTINSVNQGHGLGLSITKAYLEFLDGDIKAESSKENGNVFTITLPPAHSGEDTLIRDDDLFVDDSEIF